MKDLVEVSKNIFIKEDLIDEFKTWDIKDESVYHINILSLVKELANEHKFIINMLCHVDGLVISLFDNAGSYISLDTVYNIKDVDIKDAANNVLELLDKRSVCIYHYSTIGNITTEGNINISRSYILNADINHSFIDSSSIIDSVIEDVGLDDSYVKDSVVKDIYKSKLNVFEGYIVDQEDYYGICMQHPHDEEDINISIYNGSNDSEEKHLVVLIDGELVCKTLDVNTLDTELNKVLGISNHMRTIVKSMFVELKEVLKY